MKKLFLFVCISVFIISCNNKEEKTEAPAAGTTSSVKYDYPYTLDRPYQNWQPGDQQHAVNVLKAIKAWETKNLAECVTYFGDSVDMRFDNYHAVLPHDSLMGFMTNSWNDMASVSVKMADWESVISSDKKDQWVTVWYKQINTHKDGKIDSVGVVDDCKIVNGKIVVLDEKIQHLPAKK